MARFFEDLSTYKLFNGWANILDWILDDDRFPQTLGWTPGKKRMFTTRSRKLFGEGMLVTGANKDLQWDSLDDKSPFVQMTTDGSEGQSLIRHIRNGIAHGNVEITKRGSTLWIYICDYKDNPRIQTAFISFPMDYIIQLHRIYSEIERGIKNDKNKTKKSKKESENSGGRKDS
ncbi:MAG: hypothetical protein GX568_10875 [Candidatus Gastranaerophilales bacterium]|nr:hypothetical protein [Candidatus Gastranaerophilales bacterium]